MRPPARPRRVAALGPGTPAPTPGTTHRPPGPATSATTSRGADPEGGSPPPPVRDRDAALRAAVQATVDVGPGAQEAGTAASTAAPPARRGVPSAPAGRGMSTSWRPVRPAVVSTRSAERFAERVRMRRRLTRRRILLAGSATAVVGTVAWALLASSLLALDLRELRVEGEGTVVEPAAVEAVVAPYGGVPLPRLDTVGLRRQILEVPGVRAAEVTREWPHGLRVVLVSREPVVAVPDPDAGFALLDTDGVRVGSAAEPPAGLPVVQVPLDDPEARALTAVLSVLDQLPEEVAVQVAAVSARTRDAVELELVDGVVVEWGSADRTALKSRVLQTLRATEAGAGARVIDVSAPELPITSS